MNKQEILKQLVEKKEMLKNAEVIYHQIKGQIALLESLLQKEIEAEKKSSKKKEGDEK